eukprot:CAMPEP_0202689484 /NCGR_PEP_ID=MMETSP1385-20130828/4733_1 /ASSEMBLY_ACC=CAM_ASM_000861 /TAXON_ID=933848 /ORGANISM="Elphidium margaritaceum" /LENGTH=471 /DNA_ID=CAMNT_0049344621 /DNA_START=230 /DNA_END=1642 /DNA_ORIENTATION=-
MTRHGTRTSHRSLSEYFANDTQFYECDIATITTRVNTETLTYSAPMLQHYEDDNQWLVHSNCQLQQSWPTLLQQHQQNAQIISDAYLASDAKHHLFNAHSNNNNHNHNNLTSYIQSYTSNYERCMLSSITLLSHLLNISASNATHITPLLSTITNDVSFNPYAPWSNAMCAQQPQFTLWRNYTTIDMFDAFIIPRRHQLMREYAQTLREYEQHGGRVIDAPYEYHEHPSFRLANFYCNGMDIPLPNHTFFSLIEMGEKYASIQPHASDDDELAMEYAPKWQCTNFFYSIPMYLRFKTEIEALIQRNANAKKLVIHSAHDSSIVAFLSGMAMYHGSFPYFAQFLTLEIYGTGSNDRFLFRFTHRGEFVPFPLGNCSVEYAVLDTQLCDLNELWTHVFGRVHNATQRTWANESCATLLDDCVCGYCARSSEESGRVQSVVQPYSFFIGMCVGVLLCGMTYVVVSYIRRWLNAN